MATETHETERKYDLDDFDPGAPLPGLGSVPGVRAETGGEVHELDAVYYDTADLRLASTRATLRRRTGGDDAGWHLKLPVGGDTREELRLPLEEPGAETAGAGSGVERAGAGSGVERAGPGSGGGAGEREPGGRAADGDSGGGAVPEEFVRVLAARTRGAALVPVVRLRTRRTTRLLRDAEGRALAEIADDAVRAERLDGQERASGWVSWREAEVELTEAGTAALLDGVEERLREAGIRRAAGPSKLARALTDTGTPPPPLAPAAERDTAGGHLLRYLRAQYLAFLDHEAGTRRARPDSVHKARVALRRTRSALRSHRALLDRARVDALRAELKWLAGELGADRDREVLEKRLRELLADVEGPLLLGPAEARLTAWAVRAGDTSRARALAALDDPRCRALLDDWANLLAAPPLTPAAVRPAPKHFRKAIKKERRRSRRLLTRALALPHGPARDVALHEARKKTKRLRYAAESARPVLGKPAKRLTREAKALTSLLGDHHDGVEARAALLRLATHAQTAGEPGFTWGLLYGREEGRAREYERRARAYEAEMARRWAGGE
ncbi:CYTH and CHAD domain-containing protein [Streptomyces sp. NRRL F-5630]|uniref:CYTH and CHAD domain-containing protein n=1 Tax=unclassified Streptomyces TaxID=2593676 RepID=UPI00056CD888|nr:CYTH and CHAD domain-containing protein [Streptomyces sp. NRRL F-5630]